MKLLSLVLASSMTLTSASAFAVDTNSDANQKNSLATSPSIRANLEAAETLAEMLLLETVVMNVKAGKFAQYVVGLKAEENPDNLQRVGRAVFTAGGAFLTAFVANKLIKAGKNQLIGYVQKPEVYENWVRAALINQTRVDEAKKQLTIVEISTDHAAVEAAERNVENARGNLARAIEAADAEQITVAKAAVEDAEKILVETQGVRNLPAIEAAERAVEEAELTLMHQGPKPAYFTPKLARGLIKAGALAGMGATYFAFVGSTVVFNIDADFVNSHLAEIEANIAQKHQALVAAGWLP